MGHKDIFLHCNLKSCIMKTWFCMLLVLFTFPVLAEVYPEADADSLIVNRFLNLDSLNAQQRREYLVEEANKMVQRYAPGYYREVEPPLIDRMIVGSKNDTISAAKMRSEHKNRAYYIVTYPHDPDYEYMHYGFSVRVYFWADNGLAFEIQDGSYGWGVVGISECWMYNDPEYVLPYKWMAPRKPRKEITREDLEKLVDSLNRAQ